MASSQWLHWFWAKLGHETWPEKYHPVICHLIDVGQVAHALWLSALRDPIRNWVTERLGLKCQDEAGRWIAFWIGAHDIGKVTPCFQSKGNTDELKTRLKACGFSFTMCGDPHHTETGTKILQTAFAAGDGCPKLDRSLATKVAVAIGGHHGTFPRDWADVCGSLGDHHWANTRREILNHLTRLFGIGGQPIPTIVDGDQSVWMYLAGLTSVADWIGSNVDFFPSFGNSSIADSGFDVDGYFCCSGARAAHTLHALGWLDRPRPSNAVVLFVQATSLKDQPRPLQEKIIPIAQAMAENNSPRLIIVEAPMGEGKTEAAWYVADCWDRVGGQGTYVALPTMATSNQMFERVKKFLNKLDGKSNFMLLHGKAALNDQFEKLRFGARVYDEDGRPSGVVAEGWFAANKKHGLLAPYAVGTIDQSLLAVLQTKHVFVRLFGLAGKCVILDEVHAYDAYMTTLMERLLGWLAALGCPVVLLSATLPAEKRAKLLEAFSGTAVNDLGKNDYPRVTTIGVQDKTPVVVSFPAAGTKKISLDWVEDCDLAGNMKKALAEGGCAAVIRNTVGLAQETFTRLKEAFCADTDCVVELFHARFPFRQRQKIEEDTLGKYGKGPDGKATNPKRPKKAILVATQVIEQSLDLDFDVMFTDVAPVDLVLQRAGRLHRHERGDRGEPELCLIEPGKREKDDLPDFGASEWVYAQHILFRTLLALRNTGSLPRESIQLPGDIDPLIREVYSECEAPKNLTPIENRYWDETKSKYETLCRREQDEAEMRRIKKPSFSGALARIVGEPRAEDSPQLHPAHQALTRLMRPTVQVVCLVRDINGKLWCPHDGSVVKSLCVRPMASGGIDDIRQFLNAELTIADIRVLKELWSDPRIPMEWADVGMLHDHHLLEFVDGVVTVGSMVLHLDNELGLRVTGAELEGDE